MRANRDNRKLGKVSVTDFHNVKVSIVGEYAKTPQIIGACLVVSRLSL